MGVGEKEGMVVELVVAAGGYFVVVAAGDCTAQKAPEINERWHEQDGYRHYASSATGSKPPYHSRLHHNSQPATAIAA